MTFYDLQPLSVAKGCRYARPNKINPNEFVVGECYRNGNRFTEAIVWQKGKPSFLPLPGIQSTAQGVNAKQNVVGSVDGRPFHFINKTGTTTILKDQNGQSAFGIACAINQNEQIVGKIKITDYQPVLWGGSSAVPVQLDKGVVFQWPFTEGTGRSINDNGFISGDTWNGGPTLNQGFVIDYKKNFKLFLNPTLSNFLNYWANNINNATPPQVVGSYEGLPYLYDFTQGGLFFLTANEIGAAFDINISGEVVGNVVPTQGNYQATLWTFYGLVKVDLNHPTITNATSKGWQLVSATSINDKGFIVGTGYLNGDMSRQLPWILRPVVPIRKIPIEYMLPKLLWPGEQYDKPSPKGWPFKIPFPIPGPTPFQIVGDGFDHLQNILGGKKIESLAATLKNDKVRIQLQRIAQNLRAAEMKKLVEKLKMKSRQRLPGRKK